MGWAANNKMIKSYLVKLWDQWSVNKYKYAYDEFYQFLNVYGQPWWIQTNTFSDLALRSLDSLSHLSFRSKLTELHDCHFVNLINTMYYRTYMLKFAVIVLLFRAKAKK